MTEDSLIEVGYIIGAHGVRGEVVARTSDPDSDVLEELEVLFIDEVEYKIKHARPTPKGVLLALENLTSRDDAEKLRGKTLKAPRDLLIEDDEVLLQDLIGFRVVGENGEEFGTIDSVEIGVQDRLVVVDDEFERLIPVVDEWIISMDIDNELVTVRCDESWPKGPRE